ncbi:uncharacterized protein FRV6_11243 [Fusarium oxysporum]|uniref:Uncharacterized protein n=1 Tax=Fusarium oxysporum TaxID=5507 RepID=A0A2H3TUZ7_FUSOX|nr:uncharacterized protein FRV6_11243 [Fusarium oxysporum]
MYRLLFPKKCPDREVEACCMLSKDVDTPGPKNLVRALEDYKLEQDQSFEDWVKTILMLLAPQTCLNEEGNPIGDGGEGLAGEAKRTKQHRPPHSLTSPLAERNLIPPQEQKYIKNKCLNQRSRDESDLTEEKQGTSKRIGK